MFTREGVFSSIGRASMLAAAAAVVLAAVEPSKAYAGSASARTGVTASSGTSDATDFSAQRRYYRGGYYRGGGGAAAAALVAGVVGTGIAIAAAQSRRDYYYGPYGYYGGPSYSYYGGPAYYGGGPYYYGGGPYYGRRYYGYR